MDKPWDGRLGTAARCGAVAILMFFFCALGVLHFFLPKPVPTPVPTQHTPAQTFDDLSAHAAALANDQCEYFFELRPFKPDSYPLRLADDRYEWGRLDPIGVNGYSAIVSFARDGKDPRVSVYWSGVDGLDHFEVGARLIEEGGVLKQKR